MCAAPSVVVTRRLESAVNETPLTAPACEYSQRQRPELTSHILALPSSLPVTIAVASGLNCEHVTTAGCSNVTPGLPVTRLQARAIEFPQVETPVLPSGPSATQPTGEPGSPTTI